jgi:hypothetical protein
LTVPFTDEQKQIIDLPARARCLVDAAAGTGKTHVLAGRLMRLVERDGLSAGDEVLVLSFSRAAVSELRARLGRLEGDARYVGAATFDSFASRLLSMTEEDNEWAGWGFDRRVQAAVEGIRAGKAAHTFSLVRHVLIDEIQDLVGVRAELVMAALENVEGGFTLFGDPAQAIYEYQARDQDAGPTNTQLYEWILDTFEESLVRLGLTHDFRGRTQYADVIADIGARLRGRTPDHEAIGHELRTLLLKLPTTSLVSARRLMTPSDGVSAVLCRTNAQALRVSAKLSELGIEHRYQRRGEDRAAPSWLGRAVLDVSETRTTRTAVMPALEALAPSEGVDADELFNLIRRLDPARGDGVDLRRIAERLRTGAFPEECNEVVAAPLVVSTIHRAKGLEFERVFLCDLGDDVAETADENRLRYVALTRARRELFHVDRPNTEGLRIDGTSGRWVRRGFGSNRWRVFEVEVIGSDSDANHPAGTWLYEADARSLQEYLIEAVSPGDSVELELADSAASRRPGWQYLIRHDGRSIGVTSEAFGSTLLQILGARSRPPRAIAGLHVEMIDTVGGDGATARRYGLGAHGIWERARVFGLGTLQFGTTGAQ